MDAEQLYQSRKKEWQELSDLIARFKGDVRRFSPEEIEHLGHLYREATSDLAIAQRDFPRHQVTAYVNQLVAQAHAVVYRQEPFGWKRMRGFILRGLPRTYRSAWPFMAASAALFLVPAILAGFVIRWQPGMSQWLLPPEVQRLEETVQEEGLWTEIPMAERPYASAFIMTNNIQISFLAFGGGMLAGLLTIYILVFNGLVLGGITAVVSQYGLGLDLWNFVIGHGVIELSVIVIVGGSGLMLGWAILQPGLMRRRDALVHAARQAVKILIGLIPFLVVAGIIEGFISPHEAIPALVKWGIGITTGAGMHAYLIFSGREKKGIGPPQTEKTSQH